MYRRNQAQLLEVPSAVSVSEKRVAPDLHAPDAKRRKVAPEKRARPPEHEAKALLAASGMPVPRSIVAASRDAAVAAAREIGFPVVLKLPSPDITHKTDVGGVRLNLMDEAMTGFAYNQIVSSVASLRPDACIEGVIVQPMLRHPHQREVLAGVATDAVFGPVISFGAGGIAVEAVRDTAGARAPPPTAPPRAVVWPPPPSRPRCAPPP